MSDSATAIQVHQATLADLGNLTAAELIAMWDRLDHLNEADIPTLVAQAAPLVTATATTAALSSAALAGTIAGLVAPAVNTAPIVTTAISTLSDPFHTTWRALAEGRPWLESRGVGRSTIEAIGRNTSYQSARDAMAQIEGTPTVGDLYRPSRFQQQPTRHQRANWTRPAFARWRRVIGPNACEWCQTFSTLDYFSAETATFGHDRCDCVVVPSTDNVAEGVNQALLDDAGYDQATETRVFSELNAHSKKLRTTAKAHAHS